MYNASMFRASQLASNALPSMQVSHYPEGVTVGVADYTSLPNASGGAVIDISNGALLGIHIDV